MRKEIEKIIKDSLIDGTKLDITSMEIISESADKIEKLYSAEINSLNIKIDLLNKELSLKN